MAEEDIERRVAEVIEAGDREELIRAMHMVGTTRPRVSFFMNKFRKLGFIDYNGGLKVHSSLLSVVLRDWAGFACRRYFSTMTDPRLRPLAAGVRVDVEALR